MTKKLTAILGAALLAAALGAKEINNFFDGDFPRLIPSVQKLKRLETGYRLPADLAIAAPEAAEREASARPILPPRAKNRGCASSSPKTACRSRRRATR